MSKRPSAAEVAAALDTLQRLGEPKRFTPAQVREMTQEQIAAALAEDAAAFDHIRDTEEAQA